MLQSTPSSIFPRVLDTPLLSVFNFKHFFNYNERKREFPYLAPVLVIILFMVLFLLIWIFSSKWRFELWSITRSRSSRPEVFRKKGVLRNLTKFTRKHLCQSLFFNKVAGLRRLNAAILCILLLIVQCF